MRTKFKGKDKIACCNLKKVKFLFCNGSTIWKPYNIECHLPLIVTSAMIPCHIVSQCHSVKCHVKWYIGSYHSEWSGMLWAVPDTVITYGHKAGITLLYPKTSYCAKIQGCFKLLFGVRFWIYTQGKSQFI